MSLKIKFLKNYQKKKKKMKHQKKKEKERKVEIETGFKHLYFKN
jgi:hypothetical protein